MWEKISDYIKKNKEKYDDYYYYSTIISDEFDFLTDHAESFKASKIRLAITLILGLPTLAAGLIFGAGLPAIIAISSAIGLSSIDALASIIRFTHHTRVTARCAIDAHEMQTQIENDEKEFKEQLIKSIKKEDCTMANLNSIKTRLAYLENKRDELFNQELINSDEMVISNETDLVEYLLDKMNQMVPYTNEQEDQSLISKKINQNMTAQSTTSKANKIESSTERKNNNNNLDI